MPWKFLAGFNLAMLIVTAVALVRSILDGCDVFDAHWTLLVSLFAFCIGTGISLGMYNE